MSEPLDNATVDLAAMVCNLQFTDLPPDVVERATGVVLDFLGAALVGSSRSHVREAADLFAQYGGRMTAVALTGGRTSAPFAAFLNSLAGSSSPQLDDIWKESLGHPGVGVIPAALAVGEEVGASGRAMVEAIVGGYEVAMRIGAALGKEGLDNGWHPRGGVNVFGAAAAAGRLYGLDQSAMVNALSLAGNTAAGLTGAVHFYDAWYALSANSSLQGVVAAGLASRGYSSGPKILEADYGGFLTTIVDSPRWEWLSGLGEDEWLISHVGQKVHASSAATHAAIDATLDIVLDHDIRPDAVDQVVVHGFGAMVGRLGRPDPTSTVHAGMSIPYLVATAIVRRGAGLSEVVEAPLDDPTVGAMQRCIRLELDRRLDALCPDTLGARVEIATKSGEHVVREVLHAKGDPRNPLTSDELDAKFRQLATRVVEEPVAVAIRDAVRELPAWDSPRDVMGLLVDAARSST